MINVAVCDDNEVYLEKSVKFLKKEFSNYTNKFRIQKFTNGNIFMNEHHNNPFDIVFLDIDMPDIDGFEIAKKLRELNDNCLIIFITIHSELVYDSFDFQPFHFVHKNVTEGFTKRLKFVVEKIFNTIKQNEKIIINDRILGRHVVYLKDVMYIESNRHYAKYHINKQLETLEKRENISDLEEQLCDFDFIRVHRKYLVNLNHIFNLDMNKDTVIFKQGFELPMSRNLKHSVDKQLTEFIRRKI